MSVAIMTDTNSGISESEAKIMGIYVIPMPVLIDGDIYFEGKNLTEKDFYLALETGKSVSTSQPSPADLMSAWDELLKDYDEIVYIPMSGGLSGSCLSAKSCAQDYEGRVKVVDNHRISVTMKCSVTEAKRLADEGRKAYEIQDYLENTAYDSTIYLAVNTLEYLKRGGRITPAAAALGTVLNIKPILTIQGEKLDSCMRVRGSINKCETKMIDAVMKDWRVRFPKVKAEELHVGTAGAGLTFDEQEEWVDIVRKSFPDSDVFYNPLSASIATHTGPGAVGIGVSF